MSHYYDNDPNVRSERTSFDYFYRDTKLSFLTDHGVFSKGKIDFGSDLLISTFLNLNPPGPKKRILDVGCGYGPIGLTCAKVLPHSEVTLVDVNERALGLASDNQKHNHIDNVEVKVSNCLDNMIDKTFDFVLTNPPIRAGKEVVHRILEQSVDVLVSGGALYVVIQKKQGMPSAKKKMQEIFGNAEIVEKSKGYYILKSVKA
ncbi:class I SAM-dependent methyltransferase [Mammaliicoccus stepanovicii]|uniref:Methyltransferase domain protein n=1 Tax=Mammaliicoccus stepanovicii TaxID=643214 RepID=A0A240A9B7_9STAP|nr:class I SAM-dependent methyltransferase [Mammaliicoccus stepanovicii]PNZ77134.1 class I SAM-dependent methyltransferase [Mammaliicoccus stepanovicii]GGI39735.1 methyltransferase [Mammaliicoccus stepanovicii]SNV79967.1 methyltransferase domain protein [Mammaliicoccus stepanovicii]